MSRRHPVNLPASLRQRLLNLSKRRGEDFERVLTQYGVERLLYRLSRSSHAEQFVLKGAMLFAVWTGRLHRTTRDLDLLGYGDASEVRVSRVFRDVCTTPTEPDGVAFDPGSIRVAEIRGGQEYPGKRVQLVGHLAGARIRVQVDIGFGDAVVPGPEAIEYPTLLDLPAPRVRAYPREAAIAEKVEAMVVLGMLNSRMKDFYDLLVLAATFPFEGPRLLDAVVSTFRRRRTALPTATAPALSDAFGSDEDKVTQWRAFLRRNRLDASAPGLPEVVRTLRGFLGPLLRAAAGAQPFEQAWPPGGPWSARHGE